MIIKQLNKNDWKQFKDIRLEALQNSPTSFSSLYEEEISYPEERWINFHERGEFFGAFIDGNLIGSGRLCLRTSKSSQHKSEICGIYVKPEYRSNGVAKKIIEVLVGHGKEKGCTQIHLGCVTINISAVNLYKKCGFEIYGTEQNAIKIDGTFYDEYLMFLKL